MRKAALMKTLASSLMVGLLVSGFGAPQALAARERGTGDRSGAIAGRRIVTRGQAFDYRDIRGLSRVKFKSKQIVVKDYRIPVTAPDAGQDVTLFARVIRPKAVPRRGLPTILEVSPYHGTIADRLGTRIFPGPKKKKLPWYVKADRNFVEGDKTIGLAGYFAPRGYAVMFVDLRGTGKSGGCLDHLGQRDQSDARDVLKWIRKKKWSNDRVGMTGHSYVGSTPQMYASSQRSLKGEKPLKTIVPSAGLGAMYHHKFQHGVPYFLQWVGPAEAYEQLALQRHLPGFLGSEYGDNFGEPEMSFFGCGLPNSAVMSEEDYDSGEYDDEEPIPWDAERDFRIGASAARIPTFLVHGVNDNAARIPAIDWFHRRTCGGICPSNDPRLRIKADKVWIGQWDHGSNNFPNDRTCRQHETTQLRCNDQWTKALHAWFDKHLKKKDVRTGPKVEVFLNTRKHVYQPSQWPPEPENRYKAYYLAPGTGDIGKLVPKDKAPATETTESYIANPECTALSIFGCEYTDESEYSLAWETPKLKRPMLLAGIPRMRLWESQIGERMHVMGTLYDIAPDGTVVEVPLRSDIDSEVGISRATFAINPELRGQPPFRPSRGPNDDPNQAVVPGVPMLLKTNGMDQAYLLKKDHRLRFVVAASHHDKASIHAEGVSTVHQGGAHKSFFTVATIPQARLRRDPYYKQVGD